MWTGLPGNSGLEDSIQDKNTGSEQSRQPTESQRRDQNGEYGKDKVIATNTTRQMNQGQYRHNVRKQRQNRQRPEVKTQVDHQRNRQIVDRDGCQK